MNELKSKLIKEQKELTEKLDKLDAFLISEKIETIDDVQRALLHVQATAMNTYSQCLLERIVRIPD